MKDYKIVNMEGNDATTRQVFGYAAFTQMAKAIVQVKEAGKVTINGVVFTMDDKAIEKLDGMLAHIANRWDSPVKPEKIVRKTAELDMSFE